MSSIHEQKNELRRKIKTVTRSLSDEYKKNASAAIAEKCISNPAYKAAESIFIFVSMDGEPDTAPVISRALSDGKAVYVPRCLGGGIMEAIRLKSFDDLKPGHYGILEPKDELEPADPAEFDTVTALAFVPCVAASRSGLRLGHGAGYYDRFLENRRMRKIMLVYGRQLCDDIPCDEHDLTMDEVISE